MQTDSYKSFSYLENGDVLFSIFDTIESRSTLKPGSYVLDYEAYPHNKIVLKYMPAGESHSPLPFHKDEEIRSELKQFYNPDVVLTMKELGFLRKLGILFYGKEGTGKSSILSGYCRELISTQNAIVFYLTNPYYLDKKWEFITQIRGIQDNTIILYLDELDTMMGDGIGTLKSILDSYLSIDNFMCFATTNHIDKIPDSIAKRLSRFKYNLEITGIDSVDVIESIIIKLLTGRYPNNDFKSWASDLKGSTLDEVKQFCLDKIMNLSREKVDKKTIGFKI